MRRLFLILSIFPLLVSCGGGGGGSSSGDQTNGVTVNVQTALTSITTKGLNQNFTIGGTYSSYQATGSGNETALPATAATLNGTDVLLQSATFSGTITVSGYNVAISQTNKFYFDTTNNYEIIAEDVSANSAISGSSGYFIEHTPGADTYPTTVKAGDSGQVGTMKLYTDSTMTDQIGTATMTYSVAADGSSTSSLLVTFVTDEYDMSNTHTLKEDMTYSVDTSGNVLLVSVSRSNGGGNANSTAGTTAYNITYTFQ